MGAQTARGSVSIAYAGLISPRKQALVPTAREHFSQSRTDPYHGDHALNLTQKLRRCRREDLLAPLRAQ
jgi:hypothetical protein